MQNGDSPHVENHFASVQDHHTLTSQVNGTSLNDLRDGPCNSLLEGQASLNNRHNVPEPKTPSPLRGRKRKLSETRSTKSKKPSPPWKAFVADGPTSFKTEDGRRKSGRMNAPPPDLRSDGKMRQTRAGHNRYQNGKSAGADNSQNKSGTRFSKERPVSKRAAVSVTDSPGPRSLQKPPSESPGKISRRRDQTGTHSPLHPKRKLLRDRDATSQGHSRPQRYSLERTHTDLRTSSHKLDSNANVQLRGYSSSSTTGSRIMIRLGPRSLPILNPSNIPPAKKFVSISSWLHQDDPLEGDEDHRLTGEETVREAQARLHIIQASKAGTHFSQAFETAEQPAADEPFPGFAHIDYLVLQAQDLLTRMQHEAREHRSIAKRLAQAAAAAARAKMPKTAEELEAEARNRTQERTRSVLKQLKSHLEVATHKIMELKKHEYLEREAAAGREQMREMVDRSEGLLNARTGHLLTLEDEHTSGSDIESQSGDEVQSEGEPVSGSSDTTIDNTSSQSSPSENEGQDPDENLTLDQLRVKYSSLPEPTSPKIATATSRCDSTVADSEIAVNKSIANGCERDGGSKLDQPMPDLEDVDAVMLDNEDRESDTSGTPSEDDDDENRGDTLDDASEGGSGSEEVEGSNLLGFLSKREVDMLSSGNTQRKDDDHDSNISRPLSLQNVETLSEEPSMPSHSESVAEPLPPDTCAVPADESTKTPPDTAPAGAESQPEAVNQAVDRPDLNDFLDYTYQNIEPKLEISSLIRGQLRPYQHAGFEWLAGMYENETNGILADEMGLGKTFQTIALLAHLATRHQVWGPHLIVVPTSVILNWEIEFKKFLPGFKALSYYGSQDERREKRKGWSDPDKWNVVITSYQLALSDQIVLKRRPWHYLILDEAHNIKNHKSQRWQTLLSFRSQARLLLTGTPLQNNLAELWSLLFFLAPEQDEQGRTSFGDLTEFSKMFHRPVDQILDNGRGALDKEGIEIVSKLHQVLRPHLLRRLKADVETQMPKKYEHVTVCRLSKRQRQLYDGYMGLAGTRESFTSGNYMSIINCLMQLRKVCNHPDLFETRQIVTSFAMPKSAVAEYEIKEMLVRRRLLQDTIKRRDLGPWNLWQRNTTTFASSCARVLSAESASISASGDFLSTGCEASDGLQTIADALTYASRNVQQTQLGAVSTRRFRSSVRNELQPVYSSGLLRQLEHDILPHPLSSTAFGRKQPHSTFFERPTALDKLIPDLEARSTMMEPLIERFCCSTPNVVAPGMVRLTLTDAGLELTENSQQYLGRDPFHEARVRLSIAFPDKSLIQYDCGKLQQLDKLLRQLQAGGHRAVIFTQMTKVLDILEQFMNLHGHRYLRLDGATKIEQRQIVTERFNTDTRILAFISSSRSGGLGINLTGADTVIFYDLDWNPAMDKQCQDRCHRIGQTRDVHIYRFVSEGTIETNILRKSNQKRMLDDVVIQEGDFTTEYFNRMSADSEDGETNAAIDKVFGGGSTRMLQQAEDKEDQEAAKEAQQEELQADDADFDEKGPDQPGSAGPSQPASSADKLAVQTGATSLNSANQTLTPELHAESIDPHAREQLLDYFASNPLPQDKPLFRDIDEEGNACPGTLDGYLTRLLGWEMRDIAWSPPKSAKDKKKKKGSEFGIIRR